LQIVYNFRQNARKISIYGKNTNNFVRQSISVKVFGPTEILLGAKNLQATISRISDHPQGSTGFGQHTTAEIGADDKCCRRFCSIRTNAGRCQGSN
jgi:hypothetical protein